MKIKHPLSLLVALTMLLSLVAVAPAVADEAAPVQLTCAIPSSLVVEDYDTNEYSLWLEKEANVDLIFQPMEATTEKVQTLLAAGDLPDMLISLGINDAMLTTYGVEEGMFLALDDLIPEHCPNLVAAMQQYARGFDTLRMTDGKVYAFPVIDACQHCENAQKMWINSGFLTAVGMQMPTTTEEFYNMLVAFKTKDPNNNGQNDEIPLIGSSHTSGWYSSIDDFLLNAFVHWNRDYDGIYCQDGVVKNACEEEGYREGLRYLRKLYEEGLIYENSMVQTSADVNKIIENPDAEIVGAVDAGFVGIVATMGSERAQKLRPLTPLVGPSGRQATPMHPSLPSNGSMVLSSTCKDPVAATRIANIMYTKESTLWTRAGGKENSGWRWATEGEIGFDGNPAIWTALKPFNTKDPQNEGWVFYGVWDYSQLRTTQTFDPSVDLWTLAGNEYMLYKVTTEQYKPYEEDFSLPPLQYGADDSMTLSQLQVEQANFLNTTQVDFIVGARNLDSDWDAYVAESKMISEPLMALYQKAYDAQYK